MKATAKIAPPNSVILIMGSPNGKIPDRMNGSIVVSTDSCIAVGCRAEADGDTQFIIGQKEEVDPGSPPAFEGKLGTPTGEIRLQLVNGQTFLRKKVCQDVTTLWIWFNDPTEPNEITIGVS